MSPIFGTEIDCRKIAKPNGSIARKQPNTTRSSGTGIFPRRLIPRTPPQVPTAGKATPRSPEPRPRKNPPLPPTASVQQRGHGEGAAEQHAGLATQTRPSQRTRCHVGVTPIQQPHCGCAKRQPRHIQNHAVDADPGARQKRENEPPPCGSATPNTRKHRLPTDIGKAEKASRHSGRNSCLTTDRER